MKGVHVEFAAKILGRIAEEDLKAAVGITNELRTIRQTEGSKAAKLIDSVFERVADYSTSIRPNLEIVDGVYIEHLHMKPQSEGDGSAEESAYEGRNPGLSGITQGLTIMRPTVTDMGAGDIDAAGDSPPIGDPALFDRSFAQDREGPGQSLPFTSEEGHRKLEEIAVLDILSQSSGVDADDEDLSGDYEEDRKTSMPPSGAAKQWQRIDAQDKARIIRSGAAVERQVLINAWPELSLNEKVALARQKPSFLIEAVGSTPDLDPIDDPVARFLIASFRDLQIAAGKNNQLERALRDVFARDASDWNVIWDAMNNGSLGRVKAEYCTARLAGSLKDILEALKGKEIDTRTLKEKLSAFRDAARNTLHAVEPNRAANTLRVNHAYDRAMEQLYMITGTSAADNDLEIIRPVMDDIELVILGVQGEDMDKDFREGLVFRLKEAQKGLSGCIQSYNIPGKVELLVAKLIEESSNPGQSLKELSSQTSRFVEYALRYKAAISAFAARLRGVCAEQLPGIRNSQEFSQAIFYGMIVRAIREQAAEAPVENLQPVESYLAEIVLQSLQSMAKASGSAGFMPTVAVIIGQLPDNIRPLVEEGMPEQWKKGAAYEEPVLFTEKMQALTAGSNYQGVIVKRARIGDAPADEVYQLVQWIRQENPVRREVIGVLKPKSNIVIQELLKLMDKDDRQWIAGELQHADTGKGHVISVKKRNQQKV